MEYKAEMHRICVNIHGTKVASISYRAVITRWLFVGVALFMLYSFFQVKKVFWGSVFSPFLLVKINTPQYSTAKAKFQLEIADFP